MRRRDFNKGFSLVELLIVLAVIAALIAVITPLSLNAMRKATAVKIAYNMKALSKAMDQLFYLEGISSLENMTINDLLCIFSAIRCIDSVILVLVFAAGL